MEVGEIWARIHVLSDREPWNTKPQGRWGREAVKGLPCCGFRALSFRFCESLECFYVETLDIFCLLPLRPFCIYLRPALWRKRWIFIVASVVPLALWLWSKRNTCRKSEGWRGVDWQMLLVPYVISVRIVHSLCSCCRLLLATYILAAIRRVLGWWGPFYQKMPRKPCGSTLYQWPITSNWPMQWYARADPLYLDCTISVKNWDSRAPRGFRLRMNFFWNQIVV